MFIDFHAYEASAGSGKTFSLVVRYLTLLFSDQDADKILALTFTNKAANEMQKRIINTLSELENRAELDEIVKILDSSKEAILRKRDRILTNFLTADTKVMTLDKFFIIILRKFSLHAGLMPNFSTFESQHELKVMSRFLNLVNIKGKDNSLVSLSLLTSKRLVDIFTLLSELYAKRNEMKKISFQPVKYKVHEELVMQKVKELQKLFFATDIGKRGRATMEISNIDELLTKSWLGKESLNYWDYKKYFQPRMDELFFEIKETLAKYLRAKQEYLLSELFVLLDIYIEAKLDIAKEDNELSFDDITYLVYYLLKERIDSEFLYFRLDSKIDHILLDEFQDTSTIQFEILRPLIDEMFSGEGIKERGSLFLVGDIKQSIYRFRGGKKELFYAVTDNYSVVVDKLLTNYRSEKEIVEFVNDVFADKIEGYSLQNVKEGSRGGYVEVVFDDELLESMLNIVKELISKGADINEIAVLTATNANGSSVQEYLTAENIEVVTETTSKLIKQRNIAALIEYLKYSYFNEKIYAENFFALIEQKPQRLQPCNIDSNDLGAELKKLIDKYKLYDGDINIFSFIHKLSNYSDIEAFLFEYERLDASAVQKELNGVRVLTVHKSKGLEYEHVIVLDRLGKTKPDNSPIIYEYNGVSLENIYLRMQNRAEVDKSYRKAVEKEKELNKEDELNALYVAFTRAKESLYVIHKNKDSKFSQLQLKEERRGTLHIKTKSQLTKNTDEKFIYKELYYGTQSELLAQVKEKKQEHRAIQFGLALHYSLEMMHRFDIASLEHAIQICKNRYGAILEESEFISIKKRIETLIENTQFQRLVEGKVYKEKAISFQKELRYIDLLIEKENKWVVIDYKSSSKERESHIKQVTFYKYAIEKITSMRVDAYICYLYENKIELMEIGR